MIPRSPDVLVISTSIDSHVDAVLGALPAKVTVARLDVDRFPRDSHLSIEIDTGTVTVELDDGTNLWDISRPRFGWFRRLGAIGLHAELAKEYRAFAANESEHLLEGALDLVRPEQWINPYRPTRAAGNKLRQLSEAHRAGLSTPSTWAGTNPQTIRDWLQERPATAIAKSLSSPLLTSRDSAEQLFTFTHVLSDEERSRLTEVAVAPVQFQPFIDKAYELRVTTVSGRHFVARIDTGRTGAENDDWRVGEHHASNGDLPEPVGASLNRFLDALGLRYAASDFIVTGNGDHIFLEANPHGAWLWLEHQLPNYEVSKEIAANLTPISTSTAS